MDHAKQNDVKEAVKDFDHTNDYYFLIFNNLTKNFDVSSSSSTKSSSTSTLVPSSISDNDIIHRETKTDPDTSETKYLDYLLIDSSDGVIVRIERRSPSPSTLKIKNYNNLIDNTNKLFNYDLNSKKFSSSFMDWHDDKIYDFSDISVHKRSSSNNTAEINRLITSATLTETSATLTETSATLIETSATLTETSSTLTETSSIAATATSAETNIKKLNKSSSSSSEPLTDKSNNYNNNNNDNNNGQNDSIKRLHRDNNTLTNSLFQFDTYDWKIKTEHSSSPPPVINSSSNCSNNDNITNNCKVQHDIDGQKQFFHHPNRKQQILRNNLNGRNINIFNNSNSINKSNSNSNSSNKNNNKNDLSFYGNGDSEDDIIYDSNAEKPWICKACKRGYKWRNSLTCHQKNECGKPPKYYCSKLCGYRTNIRSNLRRHLNTKCNKKPNILHDISSSITSSQPSSLSSIKKYPTSKKLLSQTIPTSLSTTLSSPSSFSSQQLLLQASTKLNNSQNSSLNVLYKNNHSTNNRNSTRSRLLNKTIS